MEKVIMAIVGVCRDDRKSQIPSFCDMFFFWNLRKSPRKNVEFNWTSKEIRATKHHTTSSGFAPNACSFSGAVLCSDASAGSTPFALHPKKGGTEALGEAIRSWLGILLQTWGSWKKPWKNTPFRVFFVMLFFFAMMGGPFFFKQNRWRLRV